MIPEPLMNDVPAHAMALKLSINYGTTGLMDHTIELTAAPSHDAVGALKAVQEIVNAFFSKGALDGRSSIPTPEPSPVPRFKDEADGGQPVLVREPTGQMEGMEVKENKEVNGQRKSINKGITTAASVPVSTDPKTYHQPSHQQFANMSEKVDHPNVKRASAEPSTPVKHTNDDIHMDNNNPEHDRILRLTDEINRNVALAATDDAARTKIATSALELVSAVRPPADTVMGWFATMSVVSAVRLFLHWGAFEAIPTGPGERIAYSELARKVDVDEGLLSMLILPPASHHEDKCD